VSQEEETFFDFLDVCVIITIADPIVGLDYLAVHPENQRKGVGTALVESGIRYAKSVGIPIFTMAFNASRGFYERLGFREVERIVQDDSRYGGAGKYGAYFMVYDV
jgi:GNAT superfamily N-acetyltransferase